MHFNNTYRSKLPERGYGKVKKNSKLYFMEQFSKLSRAEMKMVLGGDHPVGEDGNFCTGTATCADGTKVAARLDCSDLTGGADGDMACGIHGDSISCDCDPK